MRVVFDSYLSESLTALSCVLGFSQIKVDHYVNFLSGDFTGMLVKFTSRPRCVTIIGTKILIFMLGIAIHPPNYQFGHAVWIYHILHLSSVTSKNYSQARGITVSYENNQKWCLNFGKKTQKFFNFF